MSHKLTTQTKEYLTEMRELLSKLFTKHQLSTNSEIAKYFGIPNKVVSLGLDHLDEYYLNDLLYYAETLNHDYCAQECKSVVKKTLLEMLKPATQQFLNVGLGSPKSAAADILSNADFKQYPDYAGYSAKIFAATHKQDHEARLKKTAKALQIDFAEYISVISDRVDYLKYPKSDELGTALWVLMAVTGCRGNELLNVWSVSNGYLKFDSGKGAGQNDGNLIPTLIPVEQVLAIKAMLPDNLTSDTIIQCLKNYHRKKVVKILPSLNAHPPRVTRDIYQTIAYQSMPTTLTGQMLANYVGHRNIDSGCFTIYTSGAVIKQPHDLFINLAKQLQLIS